MNIRILFTLLSPQEKNTLGRRLGVPTKGVSSRVDYTCLGQATHGQALHCVKIRPKNLSHCAMVP